MYENGKGNPDMYKKFLILLGIGCLGAALADSALEQKADEVNRVLWKRFLSPDGVLYDYAGLNGEVVLPTPEECEKDIPNALGWWTPVENGGFFTGMYLVAQCDRYDRNKTPENREKVRRLVAGLYKLQDVGVTPGFIARGVGHNGQCHYAASSNDQNFPWFLGLGRYLETDIPNAAERRECVARLKRHGEALEKLNWQIPGEKPGFVRGWWLSNEYADCVHLATATRVLYETTGEAKWKTLHDELVRGRTPNGRERRAVIAAGPENLAHWSAWFLANSQYAVRILYLRESDPKLKRCYAESLRTTGRAAEFLIERYRKFDPARPRPHFTPDWHVMMPPFREQKNGSESSKLALEQLIVWNNRCPAIAEEKDLVKPSLAAAWMVMLSGDEELIARQLPEIRRLVTGFDYSKFYYATMFYAENLIYFLPDK